MFDLKLHRVVSAVPIALGLVAGAAIAPAHAEYPDRHITLVVCFAPGGATDLLARVVSTPLSQALGTSVVVENRGGAGGNIGIAAVARAQPDGYTLLVASSAYVVNPSLFAKVPYDPFKDFVPIAEFGASPNVIAAAPQEGLKSLAELVANAKAHPDFYNYSSPGTGTTPQLAAELLKLKAGINLTHISFPGAGPAIQAILSHTVQLAALNISGVIQHIKSGGVVALVQTGGTRWPDLADVPTMAEAGFPNSESDTFQGMWAPAGTPPDIIDKLARNATAVLQQPEIRARLMESGFAVTAGGPEALRARVAREVPLWKDVIAKAGITPQ
jgi:tripartite-type tricarboxylate transporter receptor subunit TctC